MVSFGQAEEIKKVGIAEYEVGRQTVFVAERGKLDPNDLLRFLADSGAFVNQSFDLILKRPRAPSLNPAHFRVKLPS